MASGNPAKAANKKTLDDVRAAVRQGKAIKVLPWPHTEVIIRSTVEEEAVEAVSALQPLPDAFDSSHVDAYMHHYTLVLTYMAQNKGYRKRVLQGLDALAKSLRDMP